MIDGILKIATLFFSATLLWACSDDAPSGQCDPADSNCAEGMVCEKVQGDSPQCMAPVVIKGQVLDATDDDPIEGALVQTVNPNGTPMGPSATTDAEGYYEVVVPAPRDSDGKPLKGSFSLRVSAQAYKSFPSELRPAIPMDFSMAQGDVDKGWSIDSALTIVKLIPVPADVGNLGSISGSVITDSDFGVMVVAEASGHGYTGYTDSDGNFIVFNVPADSYHVMGFMAGVQLEPVDVTVGAGQDVEGVELRKSANSLSTVSGHVQIVNAPGDSKTSVVLAVESTFDESTNVGKVPVGLRVGDVTSDFSFEQVPDGNYVVLAAFENDGLVRDPDQTIGGTMVVRIQVPDPVMGNTIDLPDGFKVTEALEVISPGAHGYEVIQDSVPTFRFKNDTSEDGYDLYLYDSFGTEIWSTNLGPSSETLAVPYSGPALDSGMVYQFRAFSWRDKSGKKTYISATEALKGVFSFDVNN